MIATYYRTVTGKEPAREWISSLKDKLGRAKIMARIARAELGYLDDSRSLGNGLYELRVHFGPGYRVYYSIEGKEILLLLVAGDKSSQSRDIQTAKKYLKSHREEINHG